MVNIIEIKTVQSAAFRVLIEALKEILWMLILSLMKRE